MNQVESQKRISQIGWIASENDRAEAEKFDYFWQYKEYRIKNMLTNTIGERYEDLIEVLQQKFSELNFYEFKSKVKEISILKNILYDKEFVLTVMKHYIWEE